MSTEPQTTTDGGTAYRQADSLSSGLVTQPMLEDEPPALRVLWIRWHSGFRGSGLRVGDRIVAVNGTAFARPADLRETQKTLPRCVGQIAETQVWKEQGMPEEAPLRLTIRRRAASAGWQEQEVVGALRSACLYQNATGRYTLGPGGPDEMVNDGQGDAWSYWLEKWERLAESILDDDWNRPAFATDSARRELEAELPRLTLLAERYPGPFAGAIAEDVARIREVLDGRHYELAADALAYRQLDEERAEQVAAAGRAAREAFLNAISADVITDVPKPDLLTQECDKLAGKVLVLPSIPPRDWVTEAAHNWFAARIGDTWCLADTEGDAAQRMQIAARRYEQRVTPNLGGDYAIIGWIKPEPRLVVIGGRALIGVEVEPIAATAGDRVFVDLTVQRDGRSPFAGEDEASRSRVATAAADAPPDAVLEAFFAALKAGDQDLWLSLFADWRALDGARPLFYPYRPRVSDRIWEDARRRILQEVCDVRVVWRNDPRVVIRGDEYPGLPRVEEASHEVEHIRQVGEGVQPEFRGFRARGLTRLWRLQRLHDSSGCGPWRICTESGL